MRGPINRGQRARSIPIPAPVGGWNARDSLSAMEATDAVRLDNLFPGFGKVSLRKGFSSYATGMSSTVKTLVEFIAGANRKFIAAANGRIWDISSAGAATSLASGFTEDQWQVAQFDDSSGGALLGFVNGADAPQTYDGSAVAAMTVSGVGLTIADLVGIHVHNGRSYFWTKNSQDFWYSATGALGGVLTKFPLGRVAGFGGNLIAMGTWSVDAGNGPQDLAVFFMSSGDIIVYAGSNPGDAADWALSGRYQVGEPLGYRPLAKIGAELVAVTKAGYVPMAQAARLGADKQSGIAFSNKIHGAALQAAIDGGSLSGWQACLYPRGNYLLVNVPVTSTLWHQHVMNIQTGAWCRFTGQNGYAWGVYNNRLYFGTTSGTVYLADQTNADNAAAIQGDGQLAWNFLGTPGLLKNIGMVRVLGQAETGVIPYSLSVGVDFRDPGGVVSSSVINASTAPWDTTAWDTTPWPAEATIFDKWSGAAGFGDAVTARLRVASTSTGFDWYATTFTFEPGGIL